MTDWGEHQVTSQGKGCNLLTLSEHPTRAAALASQPAQSKLMLFAQPWDRLPHLVPSFISRPFSKTSDLLACKFDTSRSRSSSPGFWYSTTLKNFCSITGAPDKPTDKTSTRIKLQSTGALGFLQTSPLPSGCAVTWAKLAIASGNFCTQDCIMNGWPQWGTCVFGN